MKFTSPAVMETVKCPGRSISDFDFGCLQRDDFEQIHSRFAVVVTEDLPWTTFPEQIVSITDLLRC
jgi:hypothetical protein